MADGRAWDYGESVANVMWRYNLDLFSNPGSVQVQPNVRTYMQPDQPLDTGLLNYKYIVNVSQYAPLMPQAGEVIRAPKPELTRFFRYAHTVGMVTVVGDGKRTIVDALHWLVLFRRWRAGNAQAMVANWLVMHRIEDAAYAHAVQDLVRQSVATGDAGASDSKSAAPSPPVKPSHLAIEAGLYVSRVWHELLRRLVSAVASATDKDQAAAAGSGMADAYDKIKAAKLLPRQVPDRLLPWPTIWPIAVLRSADWTAAGKKMIELAKAAAGVAPVNESILKNSAEVVYGLVHSSRRFDIASYVTEIYAALTKVENHVDWLVGVAYSAYTDGEVAIMLNDVDDAMSRTAGRLDELLDDHAMYTRPAISQELLADAQRHDLGQWLFAGGMGAEPSLPLPASVVSSQAVPPNQPTASATPAVVSSGTALQPTGAVGGSDERVGSEPIIGVEPSPSSNHDSSSRDGGAPTSSGAAAAPHTQSHPPTGGVPTVGSVSQPTRQHPAGAGATASARTPGKP